MSHGYVVTKFEGEYSRWRIAHANPLTKKYIELLSCLHERIDGPKEDRYLKQQNKNVK